MTEDATEITLALLLGDAATALEAAGLRAMARGVQIASIQLEGAPIEGDTYIVDVLTLLECLDNLNAIETLDGYLIEAKKIERLAAAIESTEGPDLEGRMRNALRVAVTALEAIRASSGSAVRVSDEALQGLGVSPAEGTPDPALCGICGEPVP